MKYVVLGAGLQGPAVAYALAKKIDDSHGSVYILENNKERCNRARWLFKKIGHKFSDSQGVIIVKIEREQSPLDIFNNVSDLTVISTLPYKLNLGIAQQCIKRGWRYYDLGGHKQTSKSIALSAMEADSSVPVMTDLGLAPGLLNIVAEHALNEVENPEALLMRCGGLPSNPFVNELGYKIVFSPDGLINEYFNECEALIDGEICSINPMGDINVFAQKGELYEAFNTSGGVHTTLETARQAGCKDCRYQTIRYQGHAKILRFLKQDIGMTNEQLASMFEDKIGRTTEDFVIMSVRCANANGIWIWEKTIDHDDYFTAMQKCTGFSAASMVLTTKDIWDKPLLSYSDCPANKVMENLTDLIEISL